LYSRTETSTASNSFRFAVLTEALMRSSIFWDITLCSPFKVNRSSRGTCHLQLQSRRENSVKQATRTACSPETSADFQRTERRYIRELFNFYYWVFGLFSNVRWFWE
jgi:hypothetical protein